MSIKYHFFGKDCVIERSLANRSNLKLALERQGFTNFNVLFVNQVHGSEVVIIDDEKKIHGEQDLPKADAIVTNLPNLNIAIITADCAPILFFDEENKIIAAAHAGWPGAKASVIQNTILAMKKLGAKKINAVIGPMIHKESYEVGAEFFAAFMADDKDNERFFSAKTDGKYLFDLPAFVTKRLRESGVENIKNTAIDTYKNDKTLFSFRRSTHLKEKDCGRNVSVISSVN